jgi:hypothetical protein
MAQVVAIVTESGFGKSTSIGKNEELGIKGLPYNETAIINIKNKALPFKGWKKNFSKKISEGGNYAFVNSALDVSKVCLHLNNERKDIKYLVIDDFQYIMAEEFMLNALKPGYDKFSRLGKNIYDLITLLSSLRDDLIVFILTHADEKKVNNEETYKMKTIGKMLDEKVTLEGLFTILLYGKQTYDTTEKKVTKQYVTNYDGVYPAKSPYGMFTDLYILNDLWLIVEAIKKYEEEE